MQLHGCTMREKCSEPRICSSRSSASAVPGALVPALRSLQSAPGTKFIASALPRSDRVALHPQQRAVGGGDGDDNAGVDGVVDQEPADDGQRRRQRMRLS